MLMARLASSNVVAAAEREGWARLVAGAPCDCAGRAAVACLGVALAVPDLWPALLGAADIVCEKKLLY